MNKTIDKLKAITRCREELALSRNHVAVLRTEHHEDDTVSTLVRRACSIACAEYRVSTWNRVLEHIEHPEFNVEAVLDEFVDTLLNIGAFAFSVNNVDIDKAIVEARCNFTGQVIRMLRQLR